MPEASIVVVDDETIVAMDIADVLGRLGYRVAAVVSNGPAAIEAATAHRPDLVLMDIRLQGPMDGVQAAGIIRERLDIPIIFLTAHGDESTVRRAAGVAPYGYLVKPFDETDLHRTVEIALGRHAAEVLEKKAAHDQLWHSEERFRHLVEGVQDYAIILLDPHGIIVSWNRGAQRLTGYTAEEAIGKPVTLLYPGDALNPPDLARELATTREQGRWESEGWRARKDGTKYWAHATRTPIVDDHGGFWGFASITHDLTERRALEAQLLQAQKLESLGKLAGGIAHDFNNMLMVIFSRTEVLARLVGELQPHRRFLDDIKAAATKSRDLTQQLLAAARRQVMQPQVTQLNDVVRSTLDLLRGGIGEDITMRTDLQEPLWNIYADPSRLHQVVLNLAVNARDAMPNGGVLTVETRNLVVDAGYARQHPGLAEGEYVAFVFSDTGHGMPPEVQAQIYDPFFTTKATGTGLGLAVVRGIIEQTGGRVWVYSEVGRGTTFKIMLPRLRAALEPASAVAAETFERGTETILLVEDEQLLRDTVRETLEEHGYHVLAAASPAEALKLSAQYPQTVDLLLTDVIMAGMNGRVLSERLREQRPGLRVIFMSGYTDNAIVHHGVLEEGVRFLEKPTATSTLLKMIRTALRE